MWTRLDGSLLETCYIGELLFHNNLLYWLFFKRNTYSHVLIKKFTCRSHVSPFDHRQTFPYDLFSSMCAKCFSLVCFTIEEMISVWINDNNFLLLWSLRRTQPATFSYTSELYIWLRLELRYNIYDALVMPLTFLCPCVSEMQKIRVSFWTQILAMDRDGVYLIYRMAKLISLLSPNGVR